MKKFFAVAIVAVAVLGIALPAGAATQTVTANIAGSLSMGTSPSSTVADWALAATGANTTSGGSIGVTSNGPYTVSVTADKTRMTQYDTTAGTYVASSPKTLTAPLNVIATSTSGTGVGATAIVGTSSTLATGAGLGTDAYSVQLSQATSIADSALPSGYTYRIVLTYTAASTL
jgi:hypothetical protein